MVDNPDTSAKLRAPPDLHATGNACERCHKRVLAYIHIMRDMAQIIEFDAVAQARVTEHAPVDRTIGAHAHIVAYYHPAVMGQFHQSGRARCQPETGLANHTTRTDPAITPDDGKSDNRTCRHAGPVTDLHAASDNGIRTNMAVRSDMGTFTDRGTSTDHCIGRDDSRWMNCVTGRAFAWRNDPAGDSSKGRFGVPDGNERRTRVQHCICQRASIADNNARVRRERVGQFRTVYKYQRSGQWLAGRCHVNGLTNGIAGELTIELTGNVLRVQRAGRPVEPGVNSHRTNVY